ncbi:hypothetical protein B0H11DRAFT_2218321 [Mycena galericulata]|nr:hypothetical protein B0H11DRAFT_2218321 [Mycena galericulata]
MDTDLKCNRLTCRRPLTDKAVVSVLSGLTPSIILEICSRFVVSVPNIQSLCIHFAAQFLSGSTKPTKKTVVRNVNDKNAQLQKQLENVVREANGEISLLSNKNAELERDLELERRKVRDLQDAARERDKEYQKLKTQHDKIKRKALLAPNVHASGPSSDDPHNKLRAFSNTVNVGAVIQRTPLVNRTGASFAPASHNAGQWGHQQHPQLPPGLPPQQQQQHVQRSTTRRTHAHRQPFGGQGDRDRAYQSGHTSDRSTGSANEVENMLMGGQAPRPVANHGWSTAPTPRARAFSPRPRTNNTACPAHSAPQVFTEASIQKDPRTDHCNRLK